MLHYALLAQYACIRWMPEFHSVGTEDTTLESPERDQTSAEITSRREIRSIAASAGRGALSLCDFDIRCVLFSIHRHDALALPVHALQPRMPGGAPLATMPSGRRMSSSSDSLHRMHAANARLSALASSTGPSSWPVRWFATS